MKALKRIGTTAHRFRLAFTVDEAIDVPSESGEFFVLISRGKKGQETREVSLFCSFIQNKNNSSNNSNKNPFFRF
jgi:hypothetical protein